MPDLFTSAKHFSEMAELVLKEPRPKYMFVTDDLFRELVVNKRFGMANRFYTAELFAHIHIAALISLQRNLKWINAIKLSYENNSYFGFCANLRSFIESAADSFFSLKLAPSTLVKNHENFRLCMAGKQTKAIVTCEEMENLAIHFLQAGKHDDKTQPEKHFKAKKVMEYIESIDEGTPGNPIYTLYQKLCQVIHPARQSARLFLKQHPDGMWSVEECNDGKLIADEWVNTNNATFAVLFQKTFNASFLSLYFLDEIDRLNLPCPVIRTFNFSKVDGFSRMQQTLQKK
jgi:hypothetical protein